MLSALPVAASPVPNSLGLDDFERGNYSGWSTGGQYFSASMTGGNGSTYGVHLRQYAGGGARTWTSGGFYRMVNFTNIDTFQYTVRCVEYYDSWDAYYQVYIGGVNYGTYRSTHGWTTRTINTASITGDKLVEFRLSTNREYDDGAVIAIVLDDITVSPPIPPAPPEPEYTLYINGVSNNRNYYVNASNHPYTLFFYFQERLDFAVSDYEPGVKYFINCTSSNSSYPYSFEWMADPDSFVNWPAHLDTRANHYPSGGKYLRIQYQDVPVAYTFNMYRVEVTEGAIPDAYFELWPSFIGNWLRSRIGTSDVTLTKVDDITVVLNKVSEIPPDTPQNETSQPDLPDLPVPDLPEYVPNYTAPEPQPGNDTKVGSSFLSGYYAGVDSIIQPVNDSVSSVLSFAVSPIVTLGGSVLAMNTYLSSSLETALYYIDPLALIIDAVFNAIPAKVQFLFQLSLILVGVLVILRWR